MIRAAWSIKDGTVLDLLERLHNTFSGVGRVAIFREIEQRISNVLVYRYPRQTNAPMADLWTPKQRRYFFWALREGKIQVPHRRQFRLAPLKTELRLSQGQAVITVSLANEASVSNWAPYVIGTREQQSIYTRTRTGWLPLEAELRRQKDDMEGVSKFAIESVVRDLGFND